MLVVASGQCTEQGISGCSQGWHSAPPRMAVGLASTTPSTWVGLQLVPSPPGLSVRMRLRDGYVMARQ